MKLKVTGRVPHSPVDRDRRTKLCGLSDGLTADVMDADRIQLWQRSCDVSSAFQCPLETPLDSKLGAFS